jgi:hypothetical protein
MSIDRRQFFLGTAAGLILPSYFQKALSFLDTRGVPLLDAPVQVAHTLYARKEFKDGGYQLLLDEIDFELSKVTLREHAIEYCGSPEDYVREMEGHDEEEKVNLDGYDWDECVDEETVIESINRYDFPWGAAYDYLEHLDFGVGLEGAEAVGDLRFYDGCCPGNDYLGVEAADEITLSLLQNRLNELRKDVQIVVL